MNMKTHIFLVFMRYAEFLYPILQKHMGAINRLFIRFIPIVAVYWGKR